MSDWKLSTSSAWKQRRGDSEGADRFPAAPRVDQGAYELARLKEIVGEQPLIDFLLSDSPTREGAALFSLHTLGTLAREQQAAARNPRRRARSSLASVSSSQSNSILYSQCGEIDKLPVGIFGDDSRHRFKREARVREELNAIKTLCQNARQDAATFSFVCNHSESSDAMLEQFRDWEARMPEALQEIALMKIDPWTGKRHTWYGNGFYGMLSCVGNILKHIDDLEKRWDNAGYTYRHAEARQQVWNTAKSHYDAITENTEGAVCAFVLLHKEMPEFVVACLEINSAVAEFLKTESKRPEAARLQVKRHDFKDGNSLLHRSIEGGTAALNAALVAIAEGADLEYKNRQGKNIKEYCDSWLNYPGASRSIYHNAWQIREAVMQRAACFTGRGASEDLAKSMSDARGLLDADNGNVSGGGGTSRSTGHASRNLLGSHSVSDAGGLIEVSDSDSDEVISVSSDHDDNHDNFFNQHARPTRNANGQNATTTTPADSGNAIPIPADRDEEKEMDDRKNRGAEKGEGKRVRENRGREGRRKKRRVDGSGTTSKKQWHWQTLGRDAQHGQQMEGRKRRAEGEEQPR